MNELCRKCPGYKKCTGFESKKLILVIKFSFKLLYAFFHNWYKQTMLETWQCYKICWAIIILNAVYMMYQPTPRNWFIMCPFPYNTMFSFISSIPITTPSSHKNITFPRCSATLPTTIIFAPHKQAKTFFTMFGVRGFRYATIRAMLPTLVSLPSMARFLALFRTIYFTMPFLFSMEFSSANLTMFKHNVYFTTRYHNMSIAKWGY